MPKIKFLTLILIALIIALIGFVWLSKWKITTFSEENLPALIQKQTYYTKLAEEFIQYVNPYEVAIFDRHGNSYEDEEKQAWEQRVLSNNLKEGENPLLPPGGYIDSLKGKQPGFFYVSNQVEGAQKLCQMTNEIAGEKGSYHLITMKEWGIIAQAIKEKGKEIRGCNYYDSSFENPKERCETNKFGLRCLTGTGPETWCYEDVCDLNGNFAEWVDFPEVIDGIVKIDGKEFTLVPANYDMLKALGKEGVKNLIPVNINPSPNEKYVSGASVMINTGSEEYDYPKTIPIKRDTALGDFNQFRNGDNKKYGDGKYYLWIPTYDKNNNGIEESQDKFDVWFEILVCDNFDGIKFGNCQHYRGCQLKKKQIKENQRISSVSPELISPIFTTWDCPPHNTAPLTLLSISGYICALRDEQELKDMAIPAAISKNKCPEFFNDGYKIVPSGVRYAARGGDWKDKEKSGVFNLDLTPDDSAKYIQGLLHSFRCVKDY